MTTILTMLGWLATGLFLAGAFAAGYFVLATRRIAADAERRVPPAGRFVDVDGDRIHYVDQGEGAPILFLHGLGGQLHHFRHPLFSRFGDGHRLIAMDRPGSGYSQRRAGRGGGLKEQARAVKAFIDALGLERPLLVGHSLGGAIALATAIDHPGAISGLVLVAPLSHREETIRPEFRALFVPSRLLRWLFSHTIAVPMSLKYAGNTLAFVFGPQTWPDNYPVDGGGLAGLRPSHIYATASDLVALPAELGLYEARYGEIALPAAMIFGTADRVLDHREHGLPLASAIRGIDVEIAEGVGHMPQYAETARVIAMIRRMAARVFADKAEAESPADAVPQRAHG